MQIDSAFLRKHFHQAEADEFLIEHPKTGILMVLVPAGKFIIAPLGLNLADGSFYGQLNKRYHTSEVDIPAYYVAVHPVTNAQYAYFVNETGHPPPDNRFWQESEKLAHPLTNVSWQDATAYCQWAGLRLPRELEWEKAARGLDGRAFPWGKDSWRPSHCRNFNNKGGETTAGVWRFGQGGSPFGALQLSGNVWEWCADWYDLNTSNCYREGNLAAPSHGSYCVVRGGSWASGREKKLPGDWWAFDFAERKKKQKQDEIRDFFAGHRGQRRPGDSDNCCGFRCVSNVSASS